jgi:hypothetical protein
LTKSRGAVLSERVGSQRPTFLVLPSEGLETGAGDEAIELAALAGLELDDWQQFLLRASLAERRPGKWAAFAVDWWLGRQNGKGAGLEARQLYGLVVLRTKLSIHSAHQVKTTAEHFLRMQQLIEGCPEIERQVMRIRTGKGQEAIEMRSGCRQLFLSRSEGAGRGFAGVDDVYLDEAMYLADGMMRSIFSTMAARSKVGNPQLWITGSAPYESQVWAHARVCALREKAPGNSLFADWGTPPPSADDVERAGSLDDWIAEIVEDRDRWYAANPSLNVRISEEFCEEELSTLGPLGFAVERLGLVVPKDAENRSGIDLDEWGRRVVTEFELGAGAVVGCAVDTAGAKGSLVAAGLVDGRPHVEVVAQGGLGELVAWCERNAGTVGSLRFVKASQDALLPKLIAHTGIVCEAVADPMGAQAAFVLELPAHRGDGRLRQAILGAEKKQVGDRWKWDRRLNGDPSALLAAAWAVAGLGAGEPFFIY